VAAAALAAAAALVAAAAMALVAAASGFRSIQTAASLLRATNKGLAATRGSSNWALLWREPVKAASATQQPLLRVIQRDFERAPRSLNPLSIGAAIETWKLVPLQAISPAAAAPVEPRALAAYIPAYNRGFGRSRSGSYESRRTCFDPPSFCFSGPIFSARGWLPILVERAPTGAPPSSRGPSGPRAVISFSGRASRPSGRRVSGHSYWL
jgi:hypothetical protein